MYDYIKIGKVEVITNMGLGDLDKVLKDGFKVVEPSNWEKLELGYKHIKEMWKNGEIDLIRKIK